MDTDHRRDPGWHWGPPLPDTEAVSAELARINARLLEIEKERAHLCDRQRELLSGLDYARHAAAAALAPRPSALPEPSAPPTLTAPLPDRPEAPRAAEPVRRRRDVSQRAVQNLLLLFGGLLLAVAAIVFTVVSWGHLSIRAGVLVTITAITLAVPWPLARRGLAATAETIAFIGLVLVPLDAVAIGKALGGGEAPAGSRGVADGDAATFWGASLAMALMAAGWAWYGRYAPLRLPYPTAIVLAQAPLPLAAFAVGLTPTGMALALCATAALDLLLHALAPRHVQVERTVIAVAGVLAAGAGVGLALVVSFVPGSGGGAVRVAAVLVFAAVLAGLTARHLGPGLLLLGPGLPRSYVAQAVSGICFVAALAAPVAAVLPDGWDPAAYAAACLVVLTAGVLPAPDWLRPGFVGAGLLALALTGLLMTPYVVTALFGPLTWVASIWASSPVRARETAWPDFMWHGAPAVPVVLAASTLVAGVVSVRRRGMVPAALVLGSVAVLTLPISGDLSHAAAIAVPLGLAWALSIVALRTRAERLAATSTVVVAFAALLAVAGSLVREDSTVLVVGIVLVLLIAFAALARTEIPRVTGASGAVIAAGGLAWAVWAWQSADSRSAVVPFLLLAVRASALALVTLPAWRSRRPGQVRAFHLAAEVLTVAAVLYVPADRGLLALTWAIAAVLVAAGAWTSSGPLRLVHVIAASALAFCAPLPLGKAFFTALTGPYAWMGESWHGVGAGAAADNARAALSPDSPAWHPEPMLVPVLLLAASAAVLAVAAHAGRAATGVARVLLPVVLMPLPVAADLPYWAALAFLVAVTAGLACWAAIARGPAGVATLWSASLAASWSLAERPATLVVLAMLALIAAAFALWGRHTPEAGVAAAVASLALGAEGAAIALSEGLPREYAAFVVLAIAVLVLRSAGHLTAVVRNALLGTGAVLLVVSAGMTVPHPEPLSLVLAAGGLALVASHKWIGLQVAGLLTVATALLLHLPTFAEAMVGPYLWIDRVWTGPRDLDPGEPVAAAVAALAAGTAIASVRVLTGHAVIAATIAAPVALLPLAAHLRPSFAPAFVAVLVIALAVQACRATGPVANVAGVMAGWLATLTIAWSLADRVSTLLVLGGLAVLAGGCAVYARGSYVREGASAVAVMAVAGCSAAASLAAGASATHAAFAVLATAAAALLLAAELRTVAVEITANALCVVAVVMTAADVAWTSLALAVAGLITLGTALRPDRRQAAWAGLALLQLALWLRLAVADVTAPEAYTVTLTVAGVVVAHWIRPATSSWAVYGPALALTFVPSLVVTWTDLGLTRPLLLGVAAFTATLAGAWTRLQAPLLLGGGVLVLNAAHELGPALFDLVGQGPRWAPIAVTGLALLFAGATYEHRIRDLRRLRTSIAAMR
ncbi:SCO7613 C-terminal domain-containing membrane protein [Actinomadura sp. 6N118]|uniref:SCO7613 C-terminal domain-containing membrane protein n=1 Tax=Actinomadura sp. 6N118 TaxID=3375151 RepID=UPI0037BDE929